MFAYLVSDGGWFTRRDRYNNDVLEKTWIIGGGLHNFLVYVVTALVLWHMWRINDRTVQLAIQFEQYQNFRRKSMETIDEDGPLLEEVEIPRKITLFRVLMERKLGIDREHEFDSDDDISSQNQSLQTNQMQEGYRDVQTDAGQSFMNDSRILDLKRSHQDTKNILSKASSGTDSERSPNY